MAVTHHTVVLVPGFFGFQALGDLRYFAGVASAIESSCERRGHETSVYELASLPTASIRYRAAAVLERLAEILPETSGPVHLIGHSTGGLDLRLVLAPTASLPTEHLQKDLLRRIESVITVATPHMGTPLASFFAGAAGKPLLRVLAASLAMLLDQGRLPLRVALKLGHLLSRADNLLGLKNTTLDQLYAQLLSDFTDERRAEVTQLLEAIASDQDLIFQLTPAGVDILNAATADPEDVRYGSVVTGVDPPGLNTIRHFGHDVYAQGLHAVFNVLYRLTGRSKEPPELTDDQGKTLRDAFGHVPDASMNDGIVPTRSQIWGTLIAALRADHLDVVGHYTSAQIEGTSDWLPSGSRMNDERFSACWDAVAEFICAERRTTPKSERGLAATRPLSRH